MEAEGLLQQLGGLFVADGDVDPDQPNVAGQQPAKLSDWMLSDALLGDEANVYPGCHTNVHAACHLLGRWSPASVCAAVTERISAWGAST
jgi:hypothetical protein